jgi:hypothetical protein
MRNGSNPQAPTSMTGKIPPVNEASGGQVGQDGWGLGVGSREDRCRPNARTAIGHQVTEYGLVVRRPILEEAGKAMIAMASGASSQVGQADASFFTTAVEIWL